jgi:hypothetical protein
MMKTMKQRTATQAPIPSTLHFLSEDGAEVTTQDWHGQSVLLVFMRWLG